MESKVKVFVRLIKKHFWWLAGVVSATTLAAIVASFLAPKVYQGTARFRVDLTGANPLARAAFGVPIFISDPLLTQMSILKSRVLAEGVVKKLGVNVRVKKPKGARVFFKDAAYGDDFQFGEYFLVLKDDSVFLLDSSKALVGAGPLGGELALENARFRVEVKGLEEGDTALIAVLPVHDAALELLGSMKVQLEHGTEIMRLTIYDRDPALAARLANAYVREFADFQRRTSQLRAREARRFLEEQAALMKEEIDSLGEMISRLQSQEGLVAPSEQALQVASALRNLEVERIKLETELGVLKKQYPKEWEEVKGGAVDTSGAPELTVVALRTRLAELEQIYSPEHPAVKALREKLRAAESQAARVRMARLMMSLKGLERARDSIAQTLRSLPPKVAELLKLQKKLEAGEEVYTTIIKALYESRFQEFQDPGVVVELDTAVVDPYPVKPRKKLNAALGFLLGLLIGGLGLFLIESLRGEVISKSELEEITGLPVLVSVPKFSKGEFSPEPFRFLASGLEYMGLGDAPRVLTISSPSQGDGKSTVAEGLAKALASAGKRVILIDGDMRRPRAHQRFGIPLVPGLSDVLAGKAALADAVRSINSVDVIPGGAIPPNPSVLITTENLTRLVSQLKGYDYILVDAPPVLPVADAAYYGAISSGVLLVVRYGVTKREDAAEAAESLRKAGVKLLGVVFNAIPRSVKKYLEEGNAGKA